MNTLLNQHPSTGLKTRTCSDCVKRTLRFVVLLAAWLGLVAGSAQAQSRFDLSELGFDGFAEAADDVMVAAFEAGRVESLAVKVGDRVKVGQVIAVLDDDVQRLAVDAARGLASMRGTLNLTTAELTLHQLRYDQLTRLSENGNARPEEVARSKAEWEMATARHLAAQEEVKQRELELARAEQQWRRRQVISTVDGVVAKTFVEVGEYVLPSDLTVARVINTSSLKVVFNLPAAQAERMTLGESLSLTFTSSSRQTTGITELIAPLIDGESGTIAVTLRVENHQGHFAAGDRCALDTNRAAASGVTGQGIPSSAALVDRGASGNAGPRQPSSVRGR